MILRSGSRRLSQLISMIGVFLFFILTMNPGFSRVILTKANALGIASPGMPAPNFEGTDQNGDIHKLSDYKNKWLILYFFPKADTPGCTTEACTFRDGIMKLRKIGAIVVGVSMDDQESQEHFAKKYHIPFPLLADHSGKIAKTYGAAGGFLGFDHRYTFLISPNGTIVKRYLDVDPDRHAKQVLRDIRQLKKGKTANPSPT